MKNKNSISQTTQLEFIFMMIFLSTLGFVSGRFLYNPKIPPIKAEDKVPARIDRPFFKKVSRPPLNPQLFLDTNVDKIVNLGSAWTQTQGSPEIVVAVIDTGIDPHHPDLKNSLWHKPGTDEYGWDFTTNTKNPTDDNGHGTHIAGIIGAHSPNGQGMNGIAPNTKLMILKYCSENPKEYYEDRISNTIKAIDYAIINGAHIINYSSSGGSFQPAEFQALQRAEKAGILVVVAAGNYSVDVERLSVYPANYHLPNLIAVANTNRSGQLDKGSNYGPKTVEIAAIGDNIFSTIPLEFCQRKKPMSKDCYGFLTGTSQAAPMVAATAALILSLNPALTPPEVKQIILNSADQLPSLDRKIVSNRQINIGKAVTSATAFQGLSATLNPIDDHL